MRREAALMKILWPVVLIIAFAGCGRSPAAAKAKFEIQARNDEVHLRYESDRPFTITLGAAGDNATCVTEHSAGQGRILISEDKGALWLSENVQGTQGNRGYGCFAPRSIASILPAGKMIEEVAGVFRVGHYATQDGKDDYIILTIRQHDREPAAKP